MPRIQRINRQRPKKIYTLARKQILVLSKRECFHIAIFFRGKLNARRFFAVFL